MGRCIILLEDNLASTQPVLIKRRDQLVAQNVLVHLGILASIHMAEVPGARGEYTPPKQKRPISVFGGRNNMVVLKSHHLCGNSERGAIGPAETQPCFIGPYHLAPRLGSPLAMALLKVASDTVVRLWGLWVKMFEAREDAVAA